MSAFAVLPAQESDRDDWLAMRFALWPDSDETELAEDWPLFMDVADDNHAWIARDGDGTAVGFAEANIRSYAEDCDGPTPYLEGIWVAEKWRRSGVAAALLAVVEDWARAGGFKEMASDALLDNAVSHQWHGSQGFEEVERIVVFRKGI